MSTRLPSRLGPIALGICAAAAGCDDGVVARGYTRDGVLIDAAGAVTDGSRDADATSSPDAAPVDGAVDQAAVAMACPPPAAAVCPGPVPSFTATIVPILDASCNTCHVPDDPDAPWPLHDFDDVRAWRNLIIPDLLDCSMPPPNSGITLSEVDRQQILTWIVCDAPDN